MMKKCETCKFWFKKPATANNVGLCEWQKGMPYWFNYHGTQTSGKAGEDCEAWESKDVFDELEREMNGE